MKEVNRVLKPVRCSGVAAACIAETHLVRYSAIPDRRLCAHRAALPSCPSPTAASRQRPSPSGHPRRAARAVPPLVSRSIGPFEWICCLTRQSTLMLSPPSTGRCRPHLHRGLLLPLRGQLHKARGEGHFAEPGPERPDVCCVCAEARWAGDCVSYYWRRVPLYDPGGVWWIARGFMGRGVRWAGGGRGETENSEAEARGSSSAAVVARWRASSLLLTPERRADINYATRGS